ncbi:MAG: PEP/pyruvate-binding domain-containing protein [Jatrophihabitantaceae bacterium]
MAFPAAHAATFASIFTKEFDEPDCQDPREFGGKAAGLAGLSAAGLPVAPGFAIGAAAFRAFLDQSELRAAVAGALASENPDVAAGRLAGELASAPMPAAVAAEIARQYQRLCEQAGVVDLDVAVRSSATAEDSAAASFAGEFQTWVDVAGPEDVLAHVHRCWSSVFAARAIGYARKNGIDPAAVEMAVVVQKTVRADAAGVMFTISPVTGDRSRIVIEASWGLGLAVVGGEVTPDRWVIDKVGLSVLGFTPGDKRIEYRRGAAPVGVDPARWAQPCLSDAQVIALARLGKQIERQQGCPQDLEFAVEENRPAGEDLVLLQRRPETVWSARAHRPRFDAGHGVARWISGAVTGGLRAVPAGGHSHGDG